LSHFISAFISTGVRSEEGSSSGVVGPAALAAGGKQDTLVAEDKEGIQDTQAGLGGSLVQGRARSPAWGTGRDDKALAFQAEQDRVHWQGHQHRDWPAVAVD
jgi:hypothetical protein